jgi:hypothetical protein
MTRLVSFLVVVLVAVAFTPPAKAQNVGFVQDVANRINNERKHKGLKKLKYNATLAKAAQFHAEWMARVQKMEHLEEAPKNLDEHGTGNHAWEGGYEINMLQNGPEVLGHKVVEVARDFVVVEDIAGINLIHIPIYSVRSVTVTTIGGNK